MSLASPEVPRASLRQWLGLATVCLGTLIVAIDGTVLDVAIPAISEGLQPTSTELLWIIDVYGFVIAALLVTMGTLGDRIGRRKVLLIGIAGFGVASMLAAFATEPSMLIAARVLQGAAGATLMPATLGSIRALFPDPRQRGTAIGIWGAMWGGGAAAGPLLGGWLLEHFWWGSVFLINVPVMVALLLAAPFVVPETRDPHPGRFDLPSAGLSAFALLALVLVVKETATSGPSWLMLLLGLAGATASVVFIRRQLRIDHPLVDLTLFANPTFATAIKVNLLAVFALAGVLFYGSQYLQLVLELSPLRAGLAMLPGTVAMVGGSLLAAPLARRWGNRWALALPLLVAVAGAGVMIGLPAHGTPVPYIIGFALLCIGAGIATTLTSALVVESVPAERTGSASAISETGFELGNALGVAVLGTAVTAVYRRLVDTTGADPSVADAIRETLGGAVRVTTDLGEAGVALLASAQEAFVAAARIGSVVATVLLAATAVLAIIRLSPRMVGSHRARARQYDPNVHAEGEDQQAGGDRQQSLR